jgi:hypothetical protein
MNAGDLEERQEGRKRKGLFGRHPRLGIFAIGALFILPICVMVVIVFVLIAFQILNA